MPGVTSRVNLACCVIVATVTVCCETQCELGKLWALSYESALEIQHLALGISLAAQETQTGGSSSESSKSSQGCRKLYS